MQIEKYKLVGSYERPATIIPFSNNFFIFLKIKSCNHYGPLKPNKPTMEGV